MVGDVLATAVECGLHIKACEVPAIFVFVAKSIPHIYLHSSLWNALTKCHAHRLEEWPASGSALHTIIHLVWSEHLDQIDICPSITPSWILHASPKTDACISCFHIAHILYRIDAISFSRARVEAMGLAAGISGVRAAAPTDISAVGIPYTDMSVALSARKKLAKSRNCR